MNDNQLNTADQLALRIIFNREASQLLDTIVERLDQQGVIPLFINGNEVDKFVELLKSKGALQGFEHLDAASQYVIRDIQSEFRIKAAQYMKLDGVTEDSQILPAIKKLTEDLVSIQDAPYLFAFTQGIASKYLQAYSAAIQTHHERRLFNLAFGFSQNKEQEFETIQSDSHAFISQMHAAFPAGFITKLNHEEWRKKHYRMLSNVSFEPLAPFVTFSQCYSAFIDGKIRVRMSKTVFKGRAEELFHHLILDDILTDIPENTKLSSSKLNSLIQKLIEERPLYVTIRYVQAFLIVFSEDNKKFWSTPTSSTTGGFSIPN